MTSKLGSLLLLFQRSPLVQMLFPEAKVLGGAGLGEVTKWAVATVAGLGAYDTVGGATSIQQVFPDAGETIVPATTGEFLAFLFQIAGTPSDGDPSWSVSELPAGLTHSDQSDPSTHLISGVPTEVGSTTVTLTAWEFQNQTGQSYSQEFIIEVVAPPPPIIATHPMSVAIASGTSTTLSVVGNPNGHTLTYRWFRGTSGTTTNPISAGAGSGPSFTTPNLTTATNYWVRVTRNGVDASSNTATVSIAVAPSITTQPVSTTIPSGTTADLSIGVSGTSPAIQWFRGASGVTTDPVAGATSTNFTTPALTTSTSYWARASNAAGTVDSNAATVTVTIDPYHEWRASQFTPAQLADPAISADSADPDGDGISNQDEYVFGTPALARDPHPLTLAITNGNELSLGFTARHASGPGYAGKSRHYSLETGTELAAGTGTPLAGFADIIGSNQPVSYSAPASPPRAFYTLRVWLTP